MPHPFNNPDIGSTISLWQTVERLLNKHAPQIEKATDQINYLRMFLSSDVIELLDDVRRGRNSVGHVDKESGESRLLKDRDAWTNAAMEVFSILNVWSFSFYEFKLEDDKHFCLCNECWSDIQGAKLGAWKYYEDKLMKSFEGHRNRGWEFIGQPSKDCIFFNSPEIFTVTEKYFLGLLSREREAQKVSSGYIRLPIGRVKR